jgi:DNA replication licensing factor MCM6
MVIEAFNLLRQSIISVEKDDVEVDEEDEDAVVADGTNGHRRDRDGDSPMADADDDEDGDNGPDGGAGPSAAAPAAASGEKQKTKITYDKYISVVNILVQRVNEDEMSNGEGVDGETLVEWYLEQKENELNGEADYHAEMALTRKIIKRMVKVSSFFPLHPYAYTNYSNRKTFSWQ